MRYLDSGFRDPAQTLGSWSLGELTPEVEELRWQSGFFGSEPLGLFAPVLDRLRTEGKLTRVLIGSNDPGTLGSDVHELGRLLGLPRTNADLAVISYEQGFFHPKTYHFRRNDGSQSAYVGSANLRLGVAVRGEGMLQRNPNATLELLPNCYQT
jgi:hypothetical protein